FKKLCPEEDEKVLGRITNVLGHLTDALEYYESVLDSRDSCEHKGEPFLYQIGKKPRVYGTLFGLFNALTSDYEFPLKKKVEGCHEKRRALEAVRKAIIHLPDAFLEHRNIVTSQMSCKEKQKRIREVTAADKKLATALRATYLCCGDYYVTNKTTIKIDVPLDRLKRRPNCQRCAQHNVVNRLNGHKRACPFKECFCPKCQVVVERQKLMADQIKLRRRQKREKNISVEKARTEAGNTYSGKKQST
ncbi:DM DNA binding domain protein, partial [Oesophagostomum dentatum]